MPRRDATGAWPAHTRRAAQGWIGAIALQVAGATAVFFLLRRGRGCPPTCCCLCARACPVCCAPRGEEEEVDSGLGLAVRRKQGRKA